MNDGAPNLAKEFEQAMWNIYHTAQTLKPRMPASGFRGLLVDRGGKGTADYLLAKKELSEGFTDLYLRGKENLKLSVEYLVLTDPWRTLFSVDQLEVARTRLRRVDCELPPEDAIREEARWGGAPPQAATCSTAVVSGMPDIPLAEELPEGAYIEGAVRRITINEYERNVDARAACIAYYGATCAICGLSFGERYGPDFVGFIHVHHLKPVSAVGKEYSVDPIKDLRPVCPNCHAIIHYGGRTRTIEDVIALLR